MRFRLLGVIAVLLGVAGIALCVYALIEMPKLAVRVPSSDSGTWKLHWLASYLATGTAALLLVIGGRYILLSKRFGYLLVAAGSIGLASFPWLIEASGSARYAFERPSIWETAVLLALAVAALLGYARARALP